MSISAPETNRSSKVSSFTPFIIDHNMISSLFSEINAEYKILPIGVSCWNAKVLHNTLKKLEDAQVTLNLLQNGKRIMYVPGANVKQIKKSHSQKICALKEYISRCRYKVASSGLRVLKVSTILIQHPLMHARAEGTMIMASNALMLTRELKTHTAEQLLSPNKVTWKDKAHQIFSLTVSGIHVIYGLYLIGYSLDYVEKNDPYFEITRFAANLASVTSIAYGILQNLDLFSIRD